MTQDDQRNTAAAFRERMPSSGSPLYTPEVTEVYTPLLAALKEVSAKGGYWIQYDEKPANCSDELFELVMDRLSCEGFRVVDSTDLKGINYSIDWVQPIAFQCDALDVQMLNAVMLREDIEEAAYHLCIDVVAGCSNRAMHGMDSYSLVTHYLKYSRLDVRMHTALVAPVIKRLMTLLNEQGFETTELVRGHTDIIDIRW